MEYSSTDGYELIIIICILFFEVCYTIRPLVLPRLADGLNEALRGRGACSAEYVLSRTSRPEAPSCFTINKVGTARSGEVPVREYSRESC